MNPSTTTNPARENSSTATIFAFMHQSQNRFIGKFTYTICDTLLNSAASKTSRAPYFGRFSRHLPGILAQKK
jgi:hypothetical protein